MERTLTKLPDLDYKILSNLDDRSLLNFCRTSQYGKTLCDNKLFWENRFIKQFGRHKKSDKISWKDFYLKVVYYMDLEKYNINTAMVASIKEGNPDLVRFFISRGADDFNSGLRQAAYYGNKTLVDMFIEYGANEFLAPSILASSQRHYDLGAYLLNRGV